MVRQVVFQAPASQAPRPSNVETNFAIHDEQCRLPPRQAAKLIMAISDSQRSEDIPEWTIRTLPKERLISRWIHAACLVQNRKAETPSG